MKNYRKTFHSVYDIKYHLVRLTKYRKPLLSGSNGTRLRDLIREICKTMDIEIIKSHVSKVHVHLLVLVLPYHLVSQVLKRFKGKTSRCLLSESQILAKQCLGLHLWARGFFAASFGNVTDKVIGQYIEQQAIKERARDEDFTIQPKVDFSRRCLKPPPSGGVSLHW